MNQRSVLLGFLVFSTFLFGGTVVYDAKHKNKLKQLFGRDHTVNEWKWPDQWPNEKSEQKTPTPPVVDNGGTQITAATYEEALKRSGETGKPALVVFTADWCQWCQKTKNETLNDSGVKAVLKNYVVVIVDTDKDRTAAKKFAVESLPSFVVTNYKEDKLKAESGFKTADVFSGWLNDSSLFNQPKSEPRPDPKPNEKGPQPKDGPIRRPDRRPQINPPVGPRSPDGPDMPEGSPRQQPRIPQRPGNG